MVGERYGLTWNGQKMTKSGNLRWRLPPCSQARSGRVWRRLTVKFHGDGCLVVALLLGRHVYSSGGRNRLPRLKPDRPEMGQNDLVRGFRVFGIFFLRFWGWILTWHPKIGLYRA